MAVTFAYNRLRASPMAVKQQHEEHTLMATRQFNG